MLHRVTPNVICNVVSLDPEILVKGSKSFRLLVIQLKIVFYKSEIISLL